MNGMKRHDLIISIAKAFSAAALFMCIPASMAAQEYESTPVTISKEKVKVDGQVCYSHIVLEKQTLYSISKAYGVSVDDIYKYNPAVKENGLKKNSIILIPMENISEKKNAEIQPETVEPKPEAKAAAKPRKTHTVKWFEDIEGIAAKYGITVDALMKANNLTDRKLSKRQKLVIPSPEEYPEDAMADGTVSEDSVTDSTAVADSSAFDDRNFFPGLFSKKEVKMSLLMPLKATGTTSNRQNMDFYSGVLLAIHDMSKEGVSTDINVYDVADGNISSAAGHITNSDIVIGPVSSADLTAIYEAAPEIKALVSPLDPKAGELVKGRPAFIQAPTPHMIQYMDLVSWMKEDMKTGDRCLLITEKGARPTEAVAAMTAAADSSGIEFKTLSYSILEGRNVTESLTYLMAENAANRVYIASESEAFVNDVVRNLNLMIHKKYDVVLYAPSKIRSFETIEVENFHNTSLHVSTGYYIDYENPMVKEFLLNYRALFNTEPTQFAYQGYDLARYFITLCSKYGNRWMDRLDDHTMSLLQNTFNFQKTEDGGYQNNGVRRIIYDDDWKVNRVR
jgi:LysM repeat protein